MYLTLGQQMLTIVQFKIRLKVLILNLVVFIVGNQFTKENNVLLGIQCVATVTSQGIFDQSVSV